MNLRMFAFCQFVCIFMHGALLMHYGQTTPRLHPRPATAGGGAVHATPQMVSYCNTINDAPTHR